MEIPADESDYEYENEDDYESDYDYEECEDYDFDKKNTKIMIFKYVVHVTVIGLILCTVWLLHRDSRPEAVDTFFSPLDGSLEGTQKLVDSWVNSAKRMLGISVNPLKKRVFTRNVGEKSSVGWSMLGNKVSLTVTNKQELIEVKRAELKALRERKSDLLSNGPFKMLNDHLKEKIVGIKRMNNDSLMMIDDAFTNIHRIFYNTAICKSFTADLDRRIKLVKEIKNYTNKKKEDCVYARPVNKFLQAHCDNVDRTKLSKIVGNNGTETTLPTNFFNSFEIKPREWIFEVEVDAEQFKDSGNDLLLLHHDIEDEFYKLRSRNVHYYDRFKEINNQERVYTEFLNEFIDMKESNILILKERLRAHLNKQRDRITRLKSVHNPRTIQSSQLELWHKRQVVILFTSPKLIFLPKSQKLELEAQKMYYEKFHNWFENILRKKLYKNAKDMNKFMFRVLSDVHGPRFNLQLVLSLFQHILSGLAGGDGELNYKWTQIIEGYFNRTSFAIQQDSLVFAMAAISNRIYKIADYERIDLSKWDPRKSNYLSNEHRSSLEQVKSVVLSNSK